MIHLEKIDAARDPYRSMGFEENGEMDGEEIVLTMKL